MTDDTDDIAVKIVNALMAARERVLERESLANERDLARGSIDDHVAIELDRTEAILTIRTKAKTAHGELIVAELEATSINLLLPTCH